MADKEIPGGYYLKARCIQNSEIAHAPPHVREIWDWLIKEANHKEKKVGGKLIKRGQCIRSYQDIQDGLAWFVGWRKHSYSKSQCETAMKWLKKRTMITTAKTTRGMILTILNYDIYQDYNSYDNHKPTHRRTTVEPQTNDTINNALKRIKYINKGKTKKKTACMWPSDFILTDNLKAYAVEKGIAPDMVVPFFDDFKNWADSKGATYKDWNAAFRTRVGKSKEFGKQFLANDGQNPIKYFEGDNA